MTWLIAFWSEGFEPVDPVVVPAPDVVRFALDFAFEDVVVSSTPGSTHSCDVLRPGGAFVAKVLAGGADSQLVAELKRSFATVKHAKPPASRKDSSEWYVIAQGFKGRSDAGSGAA